MQVSIGSTSGGRTTVGVKLISCFSIMFLAKSGPMFLRNLLTKLAASLLSSFVYLSCFLK